MLPRYPNGPAVEWQLGSEHWLTHCLLGGRRPDRGAPRAQEAKPVIIGEWLREREGSLFLPDDRPGLIGRPLFYRLNSTTEAGYSHRGPASALCSLPPSCPPPPSSALLHHRRPSSSSQLWGCRRSAPCSGAHFPLAHQTGSTASRPVCILRRLSSRSMRGPICLAPTFAIGPGRCQATRWLLETGAPRDLSCFARPCHS